MSKTINILNSSSSFWKEQLGTFREEIVTTLNKLTTDSASLSLDSPISYAKFVPSTNVEKPIPHNLFDTEALAEVTRGESYTIFPELKKIYEEREGINKIKILGLENQLKSLGVEDEKQRLELNEQLRHVQQEKFITLFDLKESLSKRQVKPFLQDRLINLILQCRGAISYAANRPLLALARGEGNLNLFTITEDTKLDCKVINEDDIELNITIPLAFANTKTGEKQPIGRATYQLKVRSATIDLCSVTYTKIGKSPEAKEAFKTFCKGSTFLSKLLMNLQKILGLKRSELKEEPQVCLSK